MLSPLRPILLVLSLTLANHCLAEPADTAIQLGPLQIPQDVITQIDDVRVTVSDNASNLVSNALGLLGIRYKRGGTNALTGFDCSGFVKTVYAQTLGLVLPRRADQQAANTQKIERTELQPGDLVFFNTMRRTFSHVGIYIGEGKFIHSPKPGAKVRIEDMSTAYWKRRFDGARRVFEPAAVSSELTAPQTAQPAR
jgi:cell wall-associated NlpC family hydrolase